jgi:pimeloyl-ACP methyl ester carboxylesterase
MNNEEFFAWCQTAATKGGLAWLGRHVLVDDEPIHFIDRGVGEPLLLIHGFLEWSYTWRRNVAALAARYRVVAPDLRGFGLSAKDVRRGHSLTDQADVLCAFMDQLGIKRPVLCGHSMGGEVALRIAVNQPERVRALVLVDPSGYLRIDQHPARRLAMRMPRVSAMAVRAAVMGRRFVTRALQQALYTPGLITEADVDAYLLPALSPGAADTLVRILRDADFGAWGDRWGEVHCPTLLVWGENDPVVPLEHGRRLAQDLAQSQLVVIPECGHHPHVEYPQRFHHALFRFLGEVAP